MWRVPGEAQATGDSRVKRLAVMATCVAVFMVGCSTPDDDSGGLPQFSPPPSAAARPPTEQAAAPEPEQIVTAYRRYSAALSEALAAGDADLPALIALTRGQARRDARARVRANRQDGLVTTGALEPSATASEVEWSGGDRATVSDCVLNGLAHVTVDGDEHAEATGTRRPVEARLRRTGEGWVVARVEMPQVEDSDNPQRDPPFLRGPMPDGPPSCAPPALERELLDRYQAFWDAFDRAFGFGRDGPADPDDPALAETSVDPQLSDTRDFFRKLERKNQTSRGERDSRNPTVLGVTDFDRTAFVADCVTLGDSQTVDLDNGEVVEQNDAGRLDYYEARMHIRGGLWHLAKLDIIGEGLRQCVSPE